LLMAIPLRKDENGKPKMEQARFAPALPTRLADTMGNPLSSS
jgi:hypothetical protein